MGNRKIGIALGSGSARGWAHIGVLKGLRTLGIEPEIVTGCSAGSLVGAAYACGYLDEFEDWVCSLHWRDVMGLVDVTLSGGLVRGDKMLQFFRENDRDALIEDVERPYAAVATNMETGQEVWLREGSILEAVRASCTFPGLFAPVLRDGAWMLDGGLVNPLPVSLCRAMGADIVIAVDLNTHLVRPRLRRQEEIEASAWREKLSGLIGPQKPRQEAPGIMEVMATSIHIMQDRITRSRMAGDPPDILLTPQLAEYGMFDFSRSVDAIAEGEAVVLAAAQRIRRLTGIEAAEPVEVAEPALPE